MCVCVCLAVEGGADVSLYADNKKVHTGCNNARAQTENDDRDANRWAHIWRDLALFVWGGMGDVYPHHITHVDVRTHVCVELCADDLMVRQ